MEQSNQAVPSNQRSLKVGVPIPLKNRRAPRIRDYTRSCRSVQEVYGQIRGVVETQLRGAALSMVQGLFKEEVESLCGKPFSRKCAGQYHRRGSDPGTVLLQGQRVAVKKLRMHEGGEDVELKSHTALQHFDLLCDRVMTHMLSGVSTRDYDGLLDEIQGGLGLSRSSVSRAFTYGSKQALEQINGRDLGQHEFVSIMVDGIGFGDRTVVAAIGVTGKKDAGDKIVLGLREGDTENAEVVKDLLESLIDRGLKPFPYLFVIDGSKALRQAIRRVFAAPVQRCVRHKERNILGYLSHGHHMEFRRLWKRLHGMVDYDEALKEHEKLRHWLLERNHAAAKSLEEAELETLTVIRLRLPAALRKTLLSTNPLESMYSIVGTKKNGVKNWLSGKDQASRWAAATLLEAERRVQKIRGYREIPVLEAELMKLAVEKEKGVA